MFRCKVHGFVVDHAREWPPPENPSVEKPAGRRSHAQGCRSEDHDQKTQEAQLSEQKVRPGATEQRQRNDGLHPWRRPQSSGNFQLNLLQLLIY